MNKKWEVIISASVWPTEVLGIVDAIDKDKALIKGLNIYNNGSVTRLLASEAENVSVRLVWQSEVTQEYFKDNTSEVMKMSQIAPVAIINEKGIRISSISTPKDKKPCFDTLEKINEIMEKEVEKFLQSLNSGWDCDTGANGSHPSYCRVCTAKELLDKIKSLRC